MLVTGGAGYIGSNTCVELLHSGRKVVIVDDLRNSDAESMKRVRELTQVRRRCTCRMSWRPPTARVRGSR